MAANLIAHIQRIAQEATFDRVQWEFAADLNTIIYHYGDDPIPEPNVVIANEIQNHIIASQMQEPPRCSLKPVETGEEGDLYWAGDQAMGIQLGLEPNMVADWLQSSQSGQPTLPDDPTAQSMPPIPIPPGPLADQLRLMMETGQIKDTALVEVTDRLMAEVMQRVFDLFWERSDCDRKIGECMLDTDVIGWGWMLYEWDDDYKRHILRQIPIKQMYIDPTVRDIADAAYVGFDLPLDKDEAKKLYPDLAEQIELYRQQNGGQPIRPDSNTNWGQAYERNFQRDIVVLRVFWLPNTAIPLSPEAAVITGKVEVREIPDETVQFQEGSGDTGPSDDSVRPAGSDGGSDDAAAPASDSAGLPDEPAGGGGSDGSPLGAAPVAATPVRVAYYLPGTDIEVTPPTSTEAIPEDAPPWPTRIGVREIVQIVNNIVADRECQHWHIPIVHNVNIPIIGKPYGLGEPFRLVSIQRGRSRMLNSIVQHCEYFKAPIVSVAASVNAALPDSQKKGFVKPGTRFVWPDHLYQAFAGKPFSVQDPPRTPEALITGQDIFKQEMAEQSGHTPVMRGETEGDVKSGKAINMLQQAAVGVVDFKHRRGSQMIKRLARLMLHSIVNRLECKDIYKIISEYPYHILEAICERAKNSDWDVEVEDASGNSQTKARKKAEAAQDLQMGAISLQTYCEIAGINYHQEKRRRRVEAREAAMAAAGMIPGMPMPGMPGSPPQPGQPQPGQPSQAQPAPNQPGANGNGNSHPPAGQGGGRMS